MHGPISFRFVVLLDYFTQNLKSNIIFGNAREYLPKDAE